MDIINESVEIDVWCPQPISEMRHCEIVCDGGSPMSAVSLPEGNGQRVLAKVPKGTRNVLIRPALEAQHINITVTVSVAD